MARLQAVPRGMVTRARTSVSKYKHALRPRRSDEELLRRALPSNRSVTLLRATFRASDRAPFFFGPGEAPVIARDLERAVPGWTERTVDAGDRLRGRVFRLLGADEIRLEDFVTGHGLLPWHEDVLHGYSWDPRTFYRQVSTPCDHADIKVPWELSRCQHLPTLGMAYAATGDAGYATAVVAHIDDWITANRPGYGVNWACTMDVAIRAVNWLWAYRLVADAPQATDAFLTRLLASLLYHARHIARNIERYERGITTNHTLADYVGLLYLGLLLPDLREAPEWTRKGYDGVLACMRTQVAGDGVHYENSIAYHRLALEMFVGSYVLAERHGRDFPEDYRRSLEQMFDFVQHYTRPDGLAPLVGDSDDGRLQILSRYFDWHPQDHRYLLTVGAGVFDRDDLTAAVGDAYGVAEEAAWLLGRDALRRLSRGSSEGRSLASHAFPMSGRYVMRHQGHHAIVCTDEVGTAGKGNHKHNDILSFELSVASTAMIVDQGSFAYTGDLTWRDRFRSTSAHNTVVVDGVEQNEFSGTFGMRTDARVRVKQWRSEATVDILDASHMGYRRLADPVTHRRTIVFAKDPFAWLVLDRLIGHGDHTIESFVHLAPGGNFSDDIDCDGSPVEAAIVRLCAMVGIEEGLQARPDAAVAFSRDGVGITIVPLNVGPPSVLGGWFAPRYGKRVPATVLQFSARLSCPTLVGYLALREGERGWN
jgi:hypothetical protein